MRMPIISVFVVTYHKFNIIILGTHEVQYPRSADNTLGYRWGYTDIRHWAIAQAHY